MSPGEEALVWFARMYPVLRKLFGVRKIGIFGPAAHGEPLTKPGLDVLVEFETNFDSYRNFIGLWEYLEQELSRPVDLVTGRTMTDEQAKNPAWTETADPDRLLIARAYEECRFVAKIRTEQRSADQLRRDEGLRRAVILALITIGRAAALVSPALRESHPGISWKILTGFSEKLLPLYHEPDWRFVWEIMEREISPVERVFRSLIQEQ